MPPAPIGPAAPPRSAYEAFGWMNRGVAAVGLVVLIVGIVLLILSMRLGSTTIEDDYDIGVPRKT